MKLIELNKKQFDEYAFSQEYRNFYQTSQYGTLMARQGFQDVYLALIDDSNKILAASLILIQKKFGKFYTAYSPRGFLIDFDNTELLKEFLSLLKKYLNKKAVISLKIDPYIVHINRDENGNVKAEDSHGWNIINSLKSLGFIHYGFNLYFENLKPRWNSIIYKDKKLIDLYNRMEKNTKSSIRKAEKKGVVIEKGTKDDIKLFYSLIEKKHSRKLSYYLDYYDIFGRFNMFDIYFAKIDTNIYLKNSKMLYENEIKINAELNDIMQKHIGNKTIFNRKMNSDKLLNLYKNDIAFATKLFQNNQKEVVIAANAIIKYGDEVFFLIDGINNKYKSFDANYLLKWKIIEEYSNKGYKRFHLNGITGDFNPKNKYYGLYDFKKGFGSKVVEYIGEFNLIINNFSYNTYKRLKPIEKLFKNEKI